MRFIVDSLKSPALRASSAAPSRGGRPDRVPRLAAVAGSDVRPRPMMNGIVRVPSPRTVMPAVGKHRPERYDYRVPAAPGQEWQAEALSARRTGTGSSMRGESLFGAGAILSSRRIFSMGTATSAQDFSSVRTVQVGPERDGQRIDNCLAVLLKGVPKTHIYRLLRTGQVRVNGKRARPDTRLAAGDQLRIPPVRVAGRAESGAARPMDHLELVHRLDRDTSGVLVFARSRRGLTGVQELIRTGETKKQYLCLMTGKLRRAKFDVNAPLRKSVLQGGERMVRVDDEGKPALTFFREIERYPNCSLVEATLATGRTHQIRVHAAHAGHPLAGDPKYGEREANQDFAKRVLRRTFMHAARFEFELGERAYSFSAPLPDDLRAVLDRL